MYHILIIILCNLRNWLFIPIVLANNNFLNENEIKKNIKYITEENITNIEKQKITEKLQLALQNISEIKYSENKIKEYKNIIENFPSIIQKLHEKKNNEINIQNENNYNKLISSNDLRKHQLIINQELTKVDQELQEAQDLAHSINDSLIFLPQEHTETKKKLNNINKNITQFTTKKIISRLEQAKFIALETEKQAKQLKISELELAQLSANNRQEISRLHIEILKNKYDSLDKKSHELHIQLHKIRQKETTKTIKNIELLTEKTKKNTIFPKNITQQLEINHHLSQSLKNQVQNINLITSQQREIASHTLKIRQTLSRLLEQVQWINKSPILGEILRAQISKLPKLNVYKTQQFDHEMIKLREKRLLYEEQIHKLPSTSLQNKQNNTIIEEKQKNILNTQINIQRKLLNSLLTNYDIQILELTKLKIAHEQLTDNIQEIEKATYRYLFWIPDVHPINLSYPSKIFENLHILLNENTLYKIKYTIKTIFLKNIKISILCFVYLLSIYWLYTTYHHYYYFFLKDSKNKLKKKNKKYFSYILQNILLSSILSLPIPILWITIGYILSKTWEYPTSLAIGEGMIFSTPILWLLIMISYFTSKNGLLTFYFKWGKKKIRQKNHKKKFHIITIVTLITTLITFNNYNNKEFYDTLGRLFFIILCIYITYINYKLKKENIPLYINKYGTSNNIINHSLWNFVIIFPQISAIASYFGYLALTQTLLMYIETSLIIGITSAIFYYMIQSWMITQKHQILSHEHPINKKTILLKKRNLNRKKILSLFHINKIIKTKTNTEKKSNKNIQFTLKIINNQSLQLIRSIIILSTIIIIFFLWSEFHIIPEFIQKIILWNIIPNLHGTNNIQPITLKTLLIITLIFFITTKIIKNIPFLLKIIILQHLNLTQGTNYAIITLVKYTLILLSIIIGCTYIGIEWSKLQWLIAAIGVGLGFGLQEIFANFISGLIILFEKPIRIGDTVTICNLTGNITEIKTRATTIIDRDHKEIIIPNKEFITKKFINWSLSDTITRVVLKVPAPSNIDIRQIIEILSEAITSCPLVLKTPKPEILLTNIQQGIPLFEIKIYASKIKDRTLLQHQVHILIINFYKKHGLQLPFLHNIHIHNNQKK